MSAATEGPYRLGHLVDGAWMEHSHPSIYQRQTLDGAGERLVATAPGGDPGVLRSLAAELTPPFRLLYVLYRPRGEAPAGRYESPDVTTGALDDFFERFGDFLRRDSRFDLWIFSPADGAAVVWDRHDLVWCYGRLDAFEGRLRALGFAPGEPAIPSPHSHPDHAQHFADAAALLRFFGWNRRPLLRADLE